MHQGSGACPYSVLGRITFLSNVKRKLFPR
jgi:hypothetical protein